MILDKAISGKKFAPTADDWNSILEAAQTHRDGVHDRTVEQGEEPHRGNKGKCKNLSGAARPQFAALALRAHFITSAADLAEWKRQPNFNAYLTESADRAAPSRIGILLEPLAEDAIGDVQIAGVVGCSVNVTSTAHRYAELTTGQTYLTSGTTGGAEIVSLLTATGTQWCLVRLGTGASGASVVNDTHIVLITEPGGIDARVGLVPGVGTANIVTVNGAGELEDTAEEIDVYNFGSVAMAEDGYYLVSRDPESGKWLAEKPAAAGSVSVRSTDTVTPGTSFTCTTLEFLDYSFTVQDMGSGTVRIRIGGTAFLAGWTTNSAPGFTMGQGQLSANFATTTDWDKRFFEHMAVADNLFRLTGSLHGYPTDDYNACYCYMGSPLTGGLNMYTRVVSWGGSWLLFDFTGVVSAGAQAGAYLGMGNGGADGKTVFCLTGATGTAFAVHDTETLNYYEGATGTGGGGDTVKGGIITTLGSGSSSDYGGL